MLIRGAFTPDIMTAQMLVSVIGAGPTMTPGELFNHLADTLEDAHARGGIASLGPEASRRWSELEDVLEARVIECFPSYRRMNNGAWVLLPEGMR